MPITHVTAHRLQRTLDSSACLSLREDELFVDDKKDALLDKLKNSFFTRLARQHGHFSEKNSESSVQSSFLADKLDRFLREESSFLSLSVELMQVLEKKVNDKNGVLNAHFLFFVESMSDQHHVFYLFGVNQNESLAISEELDLTQSYSIDTGPSLFGIKVDLSEWKVRKNYSYLSQLAPRNNSILAEIFNELTGFSEGINKGEATDAFLQNIESFAKKLPSEQVNEYRNQVVDYCIEQEKKDKPVNIYGLSETLEGIDCEKFVREVLPNNLKKSDEARADVIVDRRSLRRYTKFYGRDKDLSITFSTFHLNSRVIYNEEKDSLTIEGMPKGLRKQLLAYLDS